MERLLGRRLALLLALHAAATALVLQSPGLTVAVDDLFPRALSYALAATGEELAGALVGAAGFRLHISVNGGAATCGESGLVTTYAPTGAAAAAFVVDATCVLHDAGGGGGGGGGALPLLRLQLNGSVSVSDSTDALLVGAGAFRWQLDAASAADASSGADVAVAQLDIAGMELLALRPVAAAGTPQCFHTPDDQGSSPQCGGDSYFVDSWSNNDLDEWAEGTWERSIVTGSVDINTPAGAQASCLSGAASRLAAGPLLSVIAGGWSATNRTGAAVVSTQHHLPFDTGLRSFAAPGRCSHFTIASSTIYTSFMCGSPLPFALTVGVFPDVTRDGAVSSDDLLLWRRRQYPRTDVLYRTKLPYKVLQDTTAYVGWQQPRIPFSDVDAIYMHTAALAFDGYPQVPILVGWQGLGHDTLYPALDKVNLNLGGAPALAALAARVAAGFPRSSISYHVNADEAYSRFNGSANEEFDVGMCRVNVDGVTPWAMNDSVVHQMLPDYGIRCSISKTKDAVAHGRYARYARFFSTVPQTPAIETIHSDAWRDVGSSFEPAPVGFIPDASEAYCGQEADRDFWSSHGVSLGVEGQDGQAEEMMGVSTFWLHDNGAAWSTTLFGRIAGGSSLGFDDDAHCSSGGMCGFFVFADAFHRSAKLYQMALTAELLGERDAGGDSALLFDNGGVIFQRHVPVLNEKRRGTAGRSGGSSSGGGSGGAGGAGGAALPPSTWPFGGDSIPVVDDASGVLLPTVLEGGDAFAPFVLHAFVSAGDSPPPDPTCPFFVAGENSVADDFAFSNWNEGDVIFDLNNSITVPQQIAACCAACDANVTCAGFNLVKVTGGSGHDVPQCSLFAAPVGCHADPNQAGGTKAPLPVPAPGTAVVANWTLPLSWAGKTVTAVQLTDAGERPGAVTVAGRAMQVVVQPGFPVRLTAA
jgi:hypothetical protein